MCFMSQIQISKHLLQQHPLLGLFSAADLENLIPKLKFLVSNKGDRILSTGQLSGGIFLILKGQVRVSAINSANNEATLAHINAPSFFGELSVIDQQPSMVSVDANDQCLFAIIPEVICRALLEQSPAFSKLLLERLAIALRQSNQRALMLQQKSDQRVIFFLRSAAMRQSDTALEGNMPTHEEIAAVTALSRETVSRLLSQLKKNGQLVIIKNDAGKQFSLKLAK